jgi:hypothetical protein
MRALRELLAVGMLSILPAVAHAQSAANQDTDPMPITVTAEPALAYVDRPVTLSGATLAHPKMNTVTLKVDGPSGTATLRVAADAGGRYSLPFQATKAAGNYAVAATAPDGRGTASTRFRVVDAAAAGSESGQAATELVQVAQEIIGVAQEKVSNLPPSPPKDEAMQKIATLQQNVAALSRNMPPMGQAITRLFETYRELPSRTDKLDQDRDGLLNALAESRAASARARQHLPRMRASRTTCDDLEVVVEGFKFTSFLLNLAAGSIEGAADNFAGDLAGYIAGKQVEGRGGSDAQAYAASWWAKQAPNVGNALKADHKLYDGVRGVLSGTAGTASDLSALLAAKAMSNYCEQFTGPVKAHMHAQFFQDGQKWWEYGFDLLGKVTLHYPKNATGPLVALKGRLEGYAYNFEVWEDALHVFYPNLMSSTVLAKVIVTPFSLGASGARIGTEYIEGSVAGAAMPNAFFFEVTGTASKDKLRIDVGPARSDMDPKAHVVAYTLSPLTLAIIPEVYTLPEKNAHFVFERTASFYEIPIAASGKVIRGKQHFENDVGQAAAKGHYTVDIEVCNPGC